MVIKELSAVLKNAVHRGDTIDCEGLFQISFTYSFGTIYKNHVVDVEEQIRLVGENLGMDNIDPLIRLYYSRIRTLVETGYQVNIKGVGYIIPKESETGVECTTRVSPVLKKPNMADFLVLKDSGALELCQINGEHLRFSIVLDEMVKTPCLVIQDRKLHFETVEI